MSITNQVLGEILPLIPRDAVFLNWVGNPVGEEGIKRILDFKRERGKRNGWEMQFNVDL